MNERILVAYASRNGSTGEIAGAISEELVHAGFRADAVEMKEISTLEGFDAIVIGAPVYVGHVLDDMKKLIERAGLRSIKLPVAAFAVGISPVSPDKTGSVEAISGQLRALLLPVEPAAVTVFAGKLDPEKQSFVSKMMISFMKVPTGDFRDWKKIKDWAGSLPGLMGFRSG